MQWCLPWRELAPGMVEGAEACPLGAMQSLRKQGSSVGVSMYSPDYTCIYPISVRQGNVSISEYTCLHFNCDLKKANFP